MSNGNIEMGDIHWLMDILQNIDVGLVVLDQQYKIRLWNGFMESHSGISPQLAKDKNLFSLFPDIPEQWFRQKAEPVFQLKTRTFTIWEQRPYLFHFKNYRPITGRATFMYQNTSIIPLESVNRSIDHICVIIYDVTDTALGNEESHRLRAELTKLTRIDPDTGLLKHDAWNNEAERELSRSQRTGTPSCIALLRHPAGTTTPQQRQDLAQILTKTLRQTDLATRIDDQHLAVLLPASDEGDVRFFAERVRKMLARQISNHSSVNLHAGIARAWPGFATVTHWFDAAKSVIPAEHSDPDHVIQVYEKPSTE
ncbi:diguanylate cyclase domain-containing protein [Candidatus Thalassolituus haligoni]|uniref:GGDEF domain-containing protein n=1 Tax=Candidatus Thalassolituus haligoni TaxID=3100113 RepID=UPI00351558EA